MLSESPSSKVWQKSGRCFDGVAGAENNMSLSPKTGQKSCKTQTLPNSSFAMPAPDNAAPANPTFSGHALSANRKSKVLTCGFLFKQLVAVCSGSYRVSAHLLLLLHHPEVSAAAAWETQLKAV